MLNFKSRWADASHGVFFESRIEEGTQGPSYNVYAIDASNISGKKLRYLVSKGSSPDDVWSNIAEWQHNLLQKQAKGAASGDPQKPVEKSKESPVEILLKKVEPLENVWGLEKYGFTDINCLQAMEGQPGVIDSPYTFVNERHGWEQEENNIRKLRNKYKKKVEMQAKAAASSKEKREVAEMRAISRILDKLVSRVANSHEKYLAKLERQEKKRLEREEKRIERHRYVL